MFVYNCVIYIWGGFQNSILKDILLYYLHILQPTVLTKISNSFSYLYNFIINIYNLAIIFIWNISREFWPFNYIDDLKNCFCLIKNLFPYKVIFKLVLPNIKWSSRKAWLLTTTLVILFPFSLPLEKRGNKKKRIKSHAFLLDHTKFLITLTI